MTTDRESGIYTLAAIVEFQRAREGFQSVIKLGTV